jgi:AcrR family transcriptional regulator
MTTREHQKRRWHRQFILDRAVSEFAKNGFEATTMDRIAEAAEVSKGTLYNYFASKEELIASLVEDRFARLFEAVDEVLDGEDPIEVKTQVLIRHFLELQHSGRDIHKLLFAEWERGALGLQDVLGALHRNHLQRMIERVAAMIRAGQEEGVVRAGDPMLAALVVLGVVGAQLKYATIFGEERSIDQAADELATYVLGALGVEVAETNALSGEEASR